MDPLGSIKSQIVDLVQVVEIVPMMNVWAIREQWPSGKCAAPRDPDLGSENYFKPLEEGIPQV